jgi:hypothetical protein
VSGNRVKRDEVGGCRKIHEEALHDLYFSPDAMKIRGGGSGKGM